LAGSGGVVSRARLGKQYHREKRRCMSRERADALTVL
jgi:hypothetical protein